MPVWLQDPGAWIAIGVSLLFLLAGFLMHRIILRVLKGEAPQSLPSQPPPSEQASAPPAHD
jgi:peptidoglycan/LPS O-acetylase OafA/YrhL